MGFKKPSPARIIKQNRRRAAIRQDILNGLTNQNNLAARHGVSQSMISHDMKAILRQMREEDDERAILQRNIAINRLEDVIREATVAFDRSKKKKEEVKIQYKKNLCKACDGSGKEGGDPDAEQWCEDCGGDGYTVEEHVTKKVTGTPGDSSFLREKREAIKQQAFILGLIQKAPKISVTKEETIINVDNVSSDNVIAAMRVLRNLQQEALPAPNVIDVGGEEEK